MRIEGARAGPTSVAWLSVLKRVCGMPDYPGYLAHMEEKHPGCAVLTEKDFFEEQVKARYGNGASRCC